MLPPSPMAPTVADRLRHCRSPDHLHAGLLPRFPAAATLLSSRAPPTANPSRAARVRRRGASPPQHLRLLHARAMPPPPPMASTVADRLRHCRSPDHLHAPPRRTLDMRLGFAGAVRPLPHIFGCSPLTTTTSNVVNNPSVLRFHGCSIPTPATTPGSPCSRRIWSGFSRSTVWWWCCCSTTHRSTSRLSDVYDQVAPRFPCNSN
ncbi:hypothetical protein QYE76_010156 [Lolium multiflorum]|uniref:Uncharacterized protein n=1 Tax=Lolium multiflorum TaxID=4521 RepID=A0AAD8TWP1_LOLMU|nr:hypothetical protein QYE76_010156 [Lolium multiflorum]